MRKATMVRAGRARRMMPAALLAAALAVSAVSAASAASDDAWAEFRADVAAKCLEAAKPLFASAEAIVDPFGSESYGLALVRGTAVGADVEISAICVYDKALKTVEVGGELPKAE